MAGSSMTRLIGIDVGGTNIVCGLLDVEGNQIDWIKEPTEASNGSTYVIDKIGRMIEEVLLRHQVPKEKVLAVGIGTPGFVDPIKGESVYSANLNWRNVPLAERLSQLLNLPVFVDNDVRMYVYGEAMKGAGQGFAHVLGLTIGTGLAAAVVNDGQLYYGGGFMAGELGHIPMEGIHQRCSCGMDGCLEVFVSAPGMALQVRTQIAEGHTSLLEGWYADLMDITSLDISKAYDQGDAVARQVFHQTAKYLARGLSCAVPLLSPDVIVIGGGVALAGDRLLAPLREELQKLLHPDYMRRIEIKPALWNNEAGVIGIALYAKKRVQKL